MKKSLSKYDFLYKLKKLSVKSSCENNNINKYI